MEIRGMVGISGVCRGPAEKRDPTQIRILGT